MRLHDHVRDTRNALSEYVFTNDHRTDFDNIKVFATERSLNKYIFLDMIHIYFCKESLNKRTDIDGLSNSYANILELHRSV